MTPPERHAEALADLDRRLETSRKLIVEAQHVQLTLQEPKLLGKHIPGWYLWPDVERALVAALRGLEGRKRILQRHAPEWREVRHVFGRERSKQWMCRGCSFRLWEDCPDGRDAAGLPEGTPDA